MKTLLLAIAMSTMIGLSANAQLATGHYAFVKKAYANPQDDIHSIFTKEVACSPAQYRDLFKQYFCATLDVFGGNKIYLHIERSFNTGNTLSWSSGSYVVNLTSAGKNSYAVKNRLIELRLTASTNGEVEVAVRNRVENISSRGIFNRNANVYVSENITYYFKKESDVPQGSPTEIKAAADTLIDALGISYLAYKVMKDRVIWEDLSDRSSTKEFREVRGVDMATFEVCTHTSYGFTAYAKDRYRVYYQGKVVNGVSPYDFKIIDPLHIKTSTYVYYKNAIISGADVETFESINGDYAKDKNRYYRNGQVVPIDKNIKRLLKEKEAK